ncbi:hypothetical protein BOTBODRAFT_559986 [Botryobasidium botryosum FD-172 SS1]|uniref:Lytic polysaccharide monooxygenase n=1 Tax=Botryobasidium botryosum (strain FD-172 SS1) TaxID=930990 RepID=A0A067LZ47_BOTB1|nr:hypothetical protein BOTBODRAFT_559986 [Botryobasidium botryosum FD-172 SS1]
MWSCVVAGLCIVGLAQAHVTAFHKAMYCLNGTSGKNDENNDAPVAPLYNLSKNDWWFHHVNGCDKLPPAAGDFLDLPAGGNFTVELATNRAFTTLSYRGQHTSAWPDGGHYPENYSGSPCITQPNMHTKNQKDAAGTAFAISYTSDLSKVTPENLVVFTVRYNTPWKRVVYYDVPPEMPACPPGGCICAWGWIPNGCGETNFYMGGYRCRVTNAKNTTSVAAAKPPVWCEGKPGSCMQGAKQMIFWNAQSGNNVVLSGYQADGQPKIPGYNMKMGFRDGAQRDIFRK